MRFKLLSIVIICAVATGCASKQPDSDGSQASTPGGSTATTATPSAGKADEKARTRKDSPPKPDISCSKAEDTRLLQIQEVKDGCWLFYNNQGIKKRIAWSRKTNAHCEKVRDQIRVSLEKAGYQCKWE